MKKYLKTVNINGLCCCFHVKFSVSDLTQYMGFNSNVIVIDYNGSILEKKKWEKTFLKNHDSIEILAIAGGG